MSTILIESTPNAKQAAAGIGKETAFAFAEAGVEGVIFADLNKAQAESAAEESKTYAQNPNFRAVVVEVDIVDEAAVQNMVEVAVKEFGRIDYCVHCAGVSSFPTPLFLLLTEIGMRR